MRIVPEQSSAFWQSLCPQTGQNLQPMLNCACCILLSDLFLEERLFDCIILFSKSNDVQWMAVNGKASYDRYFVIRSKANVHINVFLTAEPVVIMHWNTSFTFQTVLRQFYLERLTPKRCLQFDYTAFGFNCQLRSCRILFGFRLILPARPTITSKTKKGT